MNYTRCSTELKSLFTTEREMIALSWSGVRICNIDFHSDFSSEGFFNKQDRLIEENTSFSYPVFCPAAESNKVILLLHGLNERSWVKYLVWAYWLAENTSSYVILFPISFHINRSPAAWKDPRAMVPVMNNRNSQSGNISMSSFANAALSNRLAEDPLRFFNSGYQTTTDIIKLIKQIRAGRHRVIPAQSRLNVFAYSIGAFLAEILFLANPEYLFSRSKLFIFCGGSVFSNMQGSSKLIMDSHAFEKVYNYYLYEFEKFMDGKSRVTEFLQTSRLAMAFRSMIDLGRFKSFRENHLKGMEHRIKSTVLRKDAVIPWKGVKETLNPLNNNDIVKLMDFPFPYSHENPFPVFNSPVSDSVDKSFEIVFSQAGDFLSD